MKFYKFILIILIVFLKTGNVLSNNNIFNVNNIEIEKKGKVTNDQLANQAIKRIQPAYRKNFTRRRHKRIIKYKFFTN